MFKQITDDYIHLDNPAPLGSVYESDLPDTVTLGGGLGYARLGYRELLVGDASGFYRDFHEAHTGWLREPVRACLQRYPDSQLFMLWLREPVDNETSELTGFLIMRYASDGVLEECEDGCGGQSEQKAILKAFRDQLLRVAQGRRGSGIPSRPTALNVPASMDFRS